MKLKRFQKEALRNGDNVKLNDYQSGAVETAIYPAPLAYPTLGLCGEVGEFQTAWNDGDDDEVIKEAGDVLWYLANVANDLGLTLSELLGRKKFPTGECSYCGWTHKDPLVTLSTNAGVIAEQVKKAIRDSGGEMPDKRFKLVKKAAKEIVQTLANLLCDCECTLEEVAQRNYDKLKSRQERGKLGGDGNNR
jgi:NTP pyrophosphatase (non-canonical NTP hydrolase)